MSLIFIFIFLYLFFNSSKDQRKSDIGNKLVLGGIVMIFLLPLLELLSGGLVDVVILLALAGLIWYIVRQAKSSRASNRRKDEYGWDPKRWDAENNNPRTYDEVQKAVDAWKKYTKGRGHYAGRGPVSPEGSAGREPQKASDYDSPSGGGYRSQTGSENRNGYENSSYGSGMPPFMNPDSTTLPRRARKRRKIVEAFNQKYNLFLTDQQIQSIVNSSYMSAVWREELEAMQQRYETVYEWFQGPTSWLRVYMYVFHVQEITSDMQQQETIGMYSFESIFQYADTLEGMPLHVRIAEVNKKFFTSFDDVSFMIAYRFLESKGLYHEFRSDIPHAGDPAEDLVKKYQTAGQ